MVGEVMIAIRGSEAFNAYAADTTDTISTGTRVVVIEYFRHGPRGQPQGCVERRSNGSPDPGRWHRRRPGRPVRDLQAHVAGRRAQRGPGDLRPARALLSRGGRREHGLPHRHRQGHAGAARIQTVRRLSLDLREAPLSIECVTHQGIPLGIQGVVIFKVGDDYVSIANAARRFLDQQQQMDARVHNVFAGHLRAIVGNMTVEEMIRDREKLTSLTRQVGVGDGEARADQRLAASSGDPRPHGLHPNLALPHAAAVAREARIAQAHADREATTAEQGADALKAEARRESDQAGRLPGRDRQGLRPGPAGRSAGRRPARQHVVVEETKVAELEAQREEQRLQASIRKPADAKAYESVTLARAARDARISGAEAERQEVELHAQASAERVRLEAVAEAERVRRRHRPLRVDFGLHRRGRGGRDLRQGPGRGRGRRPGHGRGRGDQGSGRRPGREPDAVIGQQLAGEVAGDRGAAAKPFASVDQMIVLNGAQGLSEALAAASARGGRPPAGPQPAGRRRQRRQRRARRLRPGRPQAPDAAPGGVQLGNRRDGGCEGRTVSVGRRGRTTRWWRSPGRPG